MLAKMTFYSELGRKYLRYLFMKLNRTLILIFAIAGLFPPLVFRLIDLANGKGFGSLSDFLQALIVSPSVTVLISSGVVSVMIWLHKRFPWKAGIGKRLVLEIILTFSTAWALSGLMVCLLSLIGIVDDWREGLSDFLLVATVMNFALVAVTEGVFFFREWKQSAVAAEQYKKEHIRAQYESLKNQVNPHFLFNSLNTLSSLIDIDQQQSKVFLDDLSDVYRYVLQHKDEELVSLNTELTFIRAFINLLKKRHGDRLNFEINIPETSFQWGLPPMTLQLLVENAVKHNVASRKRPLFIHIYSEDDYLVVKNNLQKKASVKSTGIGLQNIRKRYQFLTQKPIEVMEDEKDFRVKTPLIKAWAMNDE